MASVLIVGSSLLQTQTVNAQPFTISCAPRTIAATVESYTTYRTYDLSGDIDRDGLDDHNTIGILQENGNIARFLDLSSGASFLISTFDDGVSRSQIPGGLQLHNQTALLTQTFASFSENIRYEVYLLEARVLRRVAAIEINCEHVTCRTPEPIFLPLVDGGIAILWSRSMSIIQPRCNRARTMPTPRSWITYQPNWYFAGSDDCRATTLHPTIFRFHALRATAQEIQLPRGTQLSLVDEVIEREQRFYVANIATRGYRKQGLVAAASVQRIGNCNSLRVSETHHQVQH